MAKTARDNTYLFFEDFSDFITSDFYKQNKDIITKYPPEKKYFNATPQYKQYRIVLKSTGYWNIQGNHTTYTIDANASNYNNILDELENLGAITSDDYYTERRRQQGQEQEQLTTALDTGYKGGYDTGYNVGVAAATPKKMSAWEGFKSGFMAPVNFALGNAHLLGV